MPSQVVQTIDHLFEHAKRNVPGAQIGYSNCHELLGILKLIERIPDELVYLPPNQYSDFVLATSTLEQQIQTWTSVSSNGLTKLVNGYDPITVIRRTLELCRDEYLPTESAELAYITDPELRESFLRDITAADRALNNAEYKAATVLAGATIEALLHWRLQQSPPTTNEIDIAKQKLTPTPPSDIDRWTLHNYIEVAAKLKILKPDTASAARLAQNFRNLIHPGRAKRLSQTCDRATAHSAIGALEHVIRDLADRKS
jgi:hypothetical protein